MKQPRAKVTDIEQIAEMAHNGQDISAHFTGQHSAKQIVSVDFPLELLRLIDQECRFLGVTREAWIKMACNDKLRRTETTPPAIRLAA
jgi:hypothetical protein